MLTAFFQLLCLLIFCGTVLIGGFMVAISLPESKMRDCCVWVFGWGLAALSVIYAVSPVDGIPGIPFDDWLVLAGGIMAAIEAWKAGKRNEQRAAA